MFTAFAIGSIVFGSYIGFLGYQSYREAKPIDKSDWLQGLVMCAGALSAVVCGLRVLLLQAGF